MPRNCQSRESENPKSSRKFFAISQIMKIHVITWISCVTFIGSTAARSETEPPVWSAKPDREITISMIPAKMAYDTTLLRVRPGAKVKLNLKNPDDLEHNLVLIKNDPEDPQGERFAAQCIELGAEGPKLAWTPDSPRVLAKSGMVGPKKEHEMFFKAPSEPGDYPYLCTFPGHSKLMRGILKVGSSDPIFSNLSYKVYAGEFRKIPDFRQLTPIKTGNAEWIDVRTLIGGEDGRAILWEGTFEVRTGGEWQFYLGSDDGAELIIDGKGVARNGGNYFFQVRKAKVRLEPGIHTMRLSYFEGGGPEALSLVADLKGAEDMIFTPDVTAKTGARRTWAGPKIVKLRKPDEALVFRTFLRGRSSRSIAVAYPGKVNINWSADSMNLDQLWRGDFVNAASNWNTRGGGSHIAGKDTVSPTGGMALQVLESIDDPWIDYSVGSSRYEKDRGPEESKELINYGIPHPDYEFKGYELDANRFPTFCYTFKGVEVKDHYRPTTMDGIEALKRTVVIRGELPPNTHLLAGVKSDFSKLPDGSYQINELMAVKIEGATPLIRSSEARMTKPPARKTELVRETRKELLVPVKGDQTIIVTYRWMTAGELDQ